MAKYKKYKKYTNSGVALIGEIPSNWGLSRLKYATNDSFMYGANESAELDDINLPRYIRITDIDDNGNLKEDTFKSMEREKAKDYLLDNNDILFARSGATVGKTYIYNKEIGEACFAGYLIRYRANRKVVIPKYVYYFTKTVIYDDWIKLNTIQATIQNVSADKYKNLEVPLPNIEEQNHIVSFLDKKTLEIGSLIVDKEKLITLLEEKRQAIITEAVTKGLNTNVKMKDSGVEWIGNIPEHWNLSKIKYQTYINIKTLSENTDEDYEIKYIDISSVNSNGEIINIENYTFKNSPSRARRILSEGDTIVSTVRTYLKAITWFEDVEENLICSTGFTVLSPQNTIYPKYLFYLMRSTRYIDEIVRRSTGVSYPAITSSEIGKIECLLPNMKEQIEIVKYIDEQIGEISDLVESTTLQIEKLKQYRQSLISEAVTGKIDVSDYCKEA